LKTTVPPVLALPKIFDRQLKSLECRSETLKTFVRMKRLPLLFSFLSIWSVTNCYLWKYIIVKNVSHKSCVWLERGQITLILIKKKNNFFKVKMITLILHFLMWTPIFHPGFRKSKKFYVQICYHVKGHTASGLC